MMKSDKNINGQTRREIIMKCQTINVRSKENFTSIKSKQR